MKTVGIVRRIDDLGRVVIPKEVRNKTDLGCGDPLEFFVDNASNILIKKYEESSSMFTCSECGKEDKRVIGKSKVCPSCVDLMFYRVDMT